MSKIIRMFGFNKKKFNDNLILNEAVKDIAKPDTSVEKNTQYPPYQYPPYQYPLYQYPPYQYPFYQYPFYQYPLYQYPFYQYPFYQYPLYQYQESVQKKEN